MNVTYVNNHQVVSNHQLCNTDVNTGPYEVSQLDMVKYVSDSRDSVRTVLGYASDAVIADGQTLLTVPVNVAVYPGQRLSGSTWYTTDADGVDLGNPVEVDVEAGATNYNLYSNEFDRWNKAGTANISSDTDVSPDGTSNADTINLPAASDFVQYPSEQTQNGEIWCTSIYLKRNQGIITLRLQQTNASQYIKQIINTNTQTNTNSSVGSATRVGSGVEPFNSVYDRYWVSGNLTTAGTLIATIIVNEGGTQTKCVAYGYQLEIGSYPTSLIYTSGAIASRAADQASTTTPPLLSISEGAQRIGFTPHQSGQVDKTIAAFYVDATHKMELTINATQAIASYTDGANTDSAAFTYSHVADTSAYVDWYWDSAANEIGVRAAHTSGNIDGETFATATFAGLTSLPATQQLGHTNGSNVFSGTVGERFVSYLDNKEARWS